MNDTQSDVAKFHHKFQVPISAAPRPVPDHERDLRIKLIDEEVNLELIPAMEDQNLPKIADGIADSIYVLLGAALTFGIQMKPIWDEVQRTNMLKEGGRFRADGKILKPVGWKPPDIERIIKAQQDRYISLEQLMLHL